MDYTPPKNALLVKPRQMRDKHEHKQSEKFLKKIDEDALLTFALTSSRRSALFPKDNDHRSFLYFYDLAAEANEELRIIYLVYDPFAKSRAIRNTITKAPINLAPSMSLKAIVWLDPGAQAYLRQIHINLACRMSPTEHVEDKSQTGLNKVLILRPAPGKESLRMYRLPEAGYDVFGFALPSPSPSSEKNTDKGAIKIGKNKKRNKK